MCNCGNLRGRGLVGRSGGIAFRDSFCKNLMLINKGLRSLSERESLGKREKWIISARFPKVIHIFFHRNAGELGKYFIARPGQPLSKVKNRLWNSTKAPVDGAFASVLPLSFSSGLRLALAP